jgi:hypothetical protein
VGGKDEVAELRGMVNAFLGLADPAEVRAANELYKLTPRPEILQQVGEELRPANGALGGRRRKVMVMQCQALPPQCRQPHVTQKQGGGIMA